VRRIVEYYVNTPNLGRGRACNYSWHSLLKCSLNRSESHKAARVRENTIYSHFPLCFHPLSSPTKCKGITRIGEEKSEIVFLLVENYNYIDAFAGFGRRGIFEPILLLYAFSLLSTVYGWACEEEDVDTEVAAVEEGVLSWMAEDICALA
jgi:hypothetical protein